MKKFYSLFYLLLLVTSTIQAQNTANFVTLWDLSIPGSPVTNGTTAITFYATTEGEVTYSWKTTDDATVTTGTIPLANTPTLVTIDNLPAGKTIELSIEPNDLKAFATTSTTTGATAKDANRLLQVQQWGTTLWTTMQYMFRNAGNFTLTATDVPNLSKVTDMSLMFKEATAFNQDISSWNTSKVTNMYGMFAYANAFNKDISSWNTSNVTNMYGMFYDARAFNQDLATWDTSKVTDMQEMFWDATAFNQDLSSWNIAKVTSMNNMLSYSGLDCTNYSATLIGWANNPNTPSNLTLGAAGTYGTNAVAARKALTDKGWTIYGDTAGTTACYSPNDYFVTLWDLSIQGSPVTNGTTAITFYATTEGEVTYSWKTTDDATVTTGTIPLANTPTLVTIDNLPAGKTIELSIEPTNFKAFATSTSNTSTIDRYRLKEVQQWGTTLWATMDYMFYMAQNFTLTATDAPNLSKVTDMSYMFYYATAFNQNLNTWNTANVTNMGYMLSYSGLDCTNYSATLIGWANNPNTPNNIPLGAIGRTYGTNAVAARKALTDKSWIITGDIAGTTVCSINPIIQAVTTTLSNKTYTVAEQLTFTVVFNEPVTVTGTPQLPIQIGTARVLADYVTGSTTQNLTFTYTIPADLYDNDGIELQDLILNGGTLVNATAHAADLILNQVAPTHNILVDSRESDLILTAVVNNTAPVVIDDVVTFTFTVTNNGPSQAPNAVATVTLPAGLTFVSDTPSQGSYISTTGLWTIGLLAPNAPQTLTLTAQTIDVGAMTVSAVVTSNITDLNNANNAESHTLTVTKKTQTLTFNSLSNKTYGDANVPLVATTTSGLPITYTSSDPTIATVVPGTNGSEIKIITVGTVTITASQLGDAMYDAASKTQPFTVDPATLSITATPQTKVYGTPDPALTYTITQGALVGNDQLSLTRLANENVGAYPITVHTFNQAANYNFIFTAAELTITKANQTLVWNQNLDLGCNSPSSIVLDAYSTSGLPINYQVANTAIANITGNTLHYVGYGTTQITATQAGDNNYLPATAVVLQAVHLSSGLIVQKWDDVLVFNNTTNNYNAWQWFKDGQLIAGATGQYYNAPQPLNGTYYVVATDTNGNQMQTCPVTIASSKQIKKMSLTPNPVKSGNSFTVHTNRTAAEIQGARLVITDMTGKLFNQVNQVTPSITLQAPNTATVYLITLFLAHGKTETVKLIVH